MLDDLGFPVGTIVGFEYDTIRTVEYPLSTMYKFPSVSTATPDGNERVANVGLVPSPYAVVSLPVPATVVMMPVLADTLLTRWFL